VKTPHFEIFLKIILKAKKGKTVTAIASSGYALLAMTARDD
jgi:hypothetical protein